MNREGSTGKIQQGSVSAFEKNRPEFEKFLEDQLDFHGKPLVLRKAIRHAVLGGGKRLRPFLCVSAAQAVAGRLVRHALPYAAAIEYLHAYTLVHDDLPAMDNDRERRGKPTVWVEFGEANAVLAGDFLQALAFECVLSEWHPSALLAGAVLAEAATSVVSGQVLDLKHAGTKSVKIIQKIHALKTAALFEAAVMMGAHAADATNPEVLALREYAKNFGFAFQIADDLADARQGEKKELSICNAMSVECAKKLAAEHVQSALDALRCFKPENVVPLVECVLKIIK